eukprot:4752521-Pleurochrysis_carterae.AAC.2
MPSWQRDESLNIRAAVSSRARVDPTVHRAHRIGAAHARAALCAFGWQGRSMVEGHSVHRVAAAHRTRLVGKAFQASSPNGRFAAGAAAINGRRFSRIEAVGKNLFAFFAVAGSPDVVVHVHFGMSGRWSVADAARAKEPTATSRLRLEGHGLVAQLSAMTVDYGGPELFAEKVAKLGSDPLRADADPEKLWERVSASQVRSVGLCHG